MTTIELRLHTDADSIRPDNADGLVIWVKRRSGFLAGYAENFAYADQLAARCNENVPDDPARVEWSPSLAHWPAGFTAPGND